jgi:thiamine-monophosphate kinase
MIDLSDGLGGDATRLAESSEVGVAIDASALPLADGVAQVAAALDRDPIELAASGGEDYELLAALPPDRVAEAASAVTAAEGLTLRPIGELVGGGGVEIRLPGGSVLEPVGFDQLA